MEGGCGDGREGRKEEEWSQDEGGAQDGRHGACSTDIVQGGRRRAESPENCQEEGERDEGRLGEKSEGEEEERSENMGETPGSADGHEEGKPSVDGQKTEEDGQTVLAFGGPDNGFDAEGMQGPEEGEEKGGGERGRG